MARKHTNASVRLLHLKAVANAESYKIQGLQRLYLSGGLDEAQNALRFAVSSYLL